MSDTTAREALAELTEWARVVAFERGYIGDEEALAAIITAALDRLKKLETTVGDVYVLLKVAIESGSSLYTPLGRLQRELFAEFTAQYGEVQQDWWYLNLTAMGHTISRLTADNDALRVWRERAMPIVEAMANLDRNDERDKQGDIWCQVCGRETVDFHDCPIVAARALLAEAKGEGDV